eukprot:6127774-Amphidinium_carterae.2
MAAACRSGACSVSPLSTSTLLLLGDTNIVCEETDVVSDCGNPRSTPFSTDAQWWKRQTADLSLLTSLWTHRHAATCMLKSIDRIYCNADVQLLSDLFPVTAVHGSPSIHPGGSDHWPVRLTWLSSSTRSSEHGFPRYVTKHPQFQQLLQLELEEMPKRLSWQSRHVRTQ